MRLKTCTSPTDNDLFLKVTTMAVEYVQAKINYQFADRKLLCSALKSAHRSDEERISDDGNRGLAKIGVCAMEMVETHNAVVAESKTESKLTFSF
jgi:hypothetical protein